MIICNPPDVHSLKDIFKWDENTLRECVNLDETVRYTNYDSYDFVSLIYIDTEKGIANQLEINIFFSKHYLVLVLPEQAGIKLSRLSDRLIGAFSSAASRSAPLTYLYYSIFDSLATDFSNTLEALEDDMEVLSEAIERNAKQDQCAEIGRLRKLAYTYKKLLRALSYIGEQISMDENKLINSDQVRYFRNIDTRLIKLYDLADNLFDLSHELLHTYDSRFSAQMNETIKKLTVITLFCAPLTVVTGIYGMNFVNMPELSWSMGYPAALGIMATISVIIYIVLRIKRWL